MESNKEELLAQALNACMEDQLSFIPPRRDIARLHTFSAEFQENMRKLLRARGREKRIISKREFVYGFNRAAACILIFLLIGGAAAVGHQLLGVKKSAGNEASMAESAYDAAPAEAPEAAPPETAEEAFAGGNEEAPEQVEFMGGSICKAPVQNLMQEHGNVKILVNSPILSTEAESVMVTIGNMEEYPIRYFVEMELEVFVDGVWYRLPRRDGAETEDTVVTLEPGMAQDEEFLFGDYELDYEAEQYRIVTYFEDMTLSAEFRFENPETDSWEDSENAEE